MKMSSITGDKPWFQEAEWKGIWLANKLVACDPGLCDSLRQKLCMKSLGLTCKEAERGKHENTGCARTQAGTGTRTKLTSKH